MKWPLILLLTLAWAGLLVFAWSCKTAATLADDPQDDEDTA